MALGGTVHQACAARGLELTAGRVSAVVTEHGSIRTGSVVLAAGAWAASFLNQLDIRFPQASVRSSILSVAPGARDVPDALHTKDVSVTRRGDGGYTLAISGGARLDPTLQQLRFARQFVPMFLSRWRSLRPGSLEALRSGHETLQRWRLDRPTPMEAVRVLDPAPDAAQIRRTHERATALLPALAGLPIQASWAGYIDSTPDGVPAMGEILPGLVLAAGFSGHGFGIGPGAGHLIADLVAGAPPIVDPMNYAPERLAGGVWGKVASF
jgi:glycine/D-amino acid oxidase-like deaminating enzyme